MKDWSSSSPCIRGCTTPVPPELIAEGLCVLHFTLRVEKTCAEMHRQIALTGANAEQRANTATYIDESTLLLARLSSHVCLSDGLKRRILSTFLSLMNLRENLRSAEGREFNLLKSSVVRARPPAAVST